MSELSEANILRSLVFFHVGNLSPSHVNLHIYTYIYTVCSHTYIYTAIAYLHTFSELFMRDILNFDSSASCFMQAVDAPLTSEVGKFVTTWDTLASPQLWQGLLSSLAKGKHPVPPFSPQSSRTQGAGAPIELMSCSHGNS